MALMTVKAIVEARDRAILVRIGLDNCPLVWLPRSAVCYGEYLHAGDAVDQVDVATWCYAEIMAAIARAKTAPPGPFGGERVIDCQIAMKHERDGR